MADERAKLMVGNVNPGTVSSQFTGSLVRTFGSLDVHDVFQVEFMQMSGIYVEELRECIVRHFLETDFEWLLMIDSDIVWDPQDVIELYLAAKDWHADYGRPCVASGLYLSHFGTSFLPIAWEDREQSQHLRFADPGPTVRDAEIVGAGFLLVPRSILVRLRETGRAFDNIGEEAGVVGEDVFFSRRVRDLGYEIIVDTAVRLAHLKTLSLYAPPGSDGPGA